MFTMDLGTVGSIRDELLDVPLSQEDNELSPKPATFFRIFTASGPCSGSASGHLKRAFPSGHLKGIYP